MRVRPALVAAKLGMNPETCTVADVRAALGEDEVADEFMVRYGPADLAEPAHGRIMARIGPATITTEQQLKDAIVQAESNGDDQLRRWIVERARALRLTRLLPADWKQSRAPTAYPAASGRDPQGRFTAADPLDGLTTDQIMRAARTSSFPGF